MPPPTVEHVFAVGAEDGALRIVECLQSWTLEAAAGTGELILTLKPPDGFAAAFAISAADASALAESLSVYSGADHRRLVTGTLN